VKLRVPDGMATGTGQEPFVVANTNDCGGMPARDLEWLLNSNSTGKSKVVAVKSEEQQPGGWPLDRMRKQLVKCSRTAQSNGLRVLLRTELRRSGWAAGPRPVSKRRYPGGFGEKTVLIVRRSVNWTLANVRNSLGWASLE